MTSPHPISPPISAFDQAVKYLSAGRYEDAYRTISNDSGFAKNPDAQHLAGLCLYEHACTDMTQGNLQDAPMKLTKACEHFQTAVDLIDQSKKKPPTPNPIYIRDLGICKLAIVELEFSQSGRTEDSQKQRIAACREIKNTILLRATKLRGHNDPLTFAFFAAVQSIAGQKNKAILTFPDIFAQAADANKKNPTPSNSRAFALITEIGHRYDLPTSRAMR